MVPKREGVTRSQQGNSSEMNENILYSRVDHKQEDA